jgi:hypothetical protein
LYAASHSTLDPTDCANHLDKCPRFRGRGKKIVGWIKTASVSRFKPLQDIAQDPASISDKRRWVKQLISDVFRLLNKPSGTLQPLDPRTITPWQKAASDFLIDFYEEVLRQSPNNRRQNIGFPAYIFSDENPSPFGAQDFLTEFQNTNQKIRQRLYICPACDESKYSTKAGTIKTDIDHYLPKSQYPHLSCHPYNLVPSCLLCNQRIKQKSDPLTRQMINPGTQRSLKDIFKLYRDSGLAEQTYLEIKLQTKNKPTEICALKAKLNYDLFEKIAVINEAHKIPERWIEQIDEIEYDIYQELGNFLGALPISLNDIQTLIDCFDYVLSSSYIQKLGKSPYSFARGWLLAALINDTEELGLQHNKLSPLLEELKLRKPQHFDELSIEDSNTEDLLRKTQARLSIAEAQKMRQTIK